MLTARVQFVTQTSKDAAVTYNIIYMYNQQSVYVSRTGKRVILGHHVTVQKGLNFATASR